MVGTIGDAGFSRIICTRVGLLLLLLAVPLLSGCLSHRIRKGFHPPKQTHLAADYVELEATFQDNFIVVEAALNGTGPYRLLLDTGASALVLSAAVQERANLARLSTKEEITVIGGTRSMRADVVRVDVLQAGGLRLGGVRALVPERTRWEGLSHSVAQAAMMEGIDGILGMNAFAGVILEIDFPRRKVVLHRRERADFPLRGPSSASS